MALTKIQSEVLAITKTVLNKMNDEGMNCFAIGGTAIGAVRHRGFIPWDDDLDLGMVQEDFRKLIKRLELEPDFFNGVKVSLPNTAENPFCYLKVFSESDFSSKFVDLGNNRRGIFIDVFPLSKYNNRTVNHLKYMMFRLIDKTTLYKFNASPLSGRVGKLRAVVKVATLVPAKVLFKLRLWLMKDVNDEFFDSYINFGGRWYLEETKKDEITEFKTFDFENIKVKLPVGFDGILRRTYGDYRKLPDEAERHGTHLG